MNASEVIANRALELLGHRRGDYRHLHPNDDDNLSQSTNDVYPTAVKIGVYLSMQETLSVMGELKAAEFADVLKMGRTHWS
jgi:aspartate ammonia-lyase